MSISPPRNPSPSTIRPPLGSSSSLNDEYQVGEHNPYLIQSVEDAETEGLLRGLEVKDRISLENAHAISRLTRENERLRNEISQRENFLETEREERAQLESENISLERQIIEYRQVGVRPIQTSLLSPTREEVSFSRRLWTGVRNGASSVGRFSRRHLQLFEAGIGLGGVISAFFYQPYALPIVLATGVAIKLFSWVTSFFEY